MLYLWANNMNTFLAFRFGTNHDLNYGGKKYVQNTWRRKEFKQCVQLFNLVRLWSESPTQLERKKISLLLLEAYIELCLKEKKYSDRN